MPLASSVLAINAGSSSIKFAIYTATRPLTSSLRGRLERIGLDGTTLSWRSADGATGQQPLDVPNREAAAQRLIEWLEARGAFASLGGAGHRVVHGLTRTEPTRITPDVLDELHRATPYAPDHLPREIQLIEALGARHPRLPQVACFDTAFHAGMPRVARMLAIPRRYFERGVQRYGFHGLSFEYLLQELARVAGEDAARGRVILAHLGNGVSLAAVHRGRCVDTSMGLTPAAGLVMSTRSGDLDPGLVAYLARTERTTPDDFDRMVNHESGLLGLSGLSSDMSDLLARERDDACAADAVAVFCYQAKKWIGSFAAALSGLDTLVFTAGIGERSAPVRARVCDGLAFFGIDLDEARNAAHAPVISTGASRVTVRVIRTDEELMIARSVIRVLGLNTDRTECEA